MINIELASPPDLQLYFQPNEDKEKSGDLTINHFSCKWVRNLGSLAALNEYSLFFPVLVNVIWDVFIFKL